MLVQQSCLGVANVKIAENEIGNLNNILMLIGYYTSQTVCDCVFLLLPHFQPKFSKAE